jgi:hypothetical protein
MTAFAIPALTAVLIAACLGAAVVLVAGPSHRWTWSAYRPLLAALRRLDDAGQASAEYALVLLGAAGVALMVTLWAGHNDRIGRLMDTVFDHLLHRVK